MKKEQQVEKFKYSFNESEYQKQSRKLKDIEKTLNEFRNIALQFTTETLPEGYSEILASVNKELDRKLPGGIPRKIAAAMGKEEKYLTLLSFEKTLSSERLLGLYGSYLTFEKERGYKFTEKAYESLRERFTGYLTDLLEIDLYKRIEAIIGAYSELTKELDKGMWMDSMHRFGRSSNMFSMPQSFVVKPSVSYIKSAVKSMKRKNVSL